MTTTTTSNPTPIDPGAAAVGSLLSSIEAGTGIPATIYAPDAFLDATVPNWRLEASGAAAVAAELSRWYGHPGRLESVERRPVSDGEVVTIELSWVEGGIPHAAHQAHVLVLDAHGRIARHEVFCGGRWPASLLAQMEDARGR